MEDINHFLTICACFLLGVLLWLLRAMYQSSQSIAGNTDCDERKETSLLSLPGELRNEIYRLVLVRTGPNREIEYTASSYERPALLNTCKAIRAEVLKIFYCENSFFTTVHNFNSDHMLKWETQLDSMDVATDENGEDCIEALCRVDYSQPPWSNLMLWHRRYHDDQVLDSPDTPDLLVYRPAEVSLTEFVIGAMFATVELMCNEPWEKIEGVLRRWQPALVSEDYRWIND